jgi:general secretion pathway protein K
MPAVTAIVGVRRPRERGFVLVAALWMLILLSVLAASYSSSTRTNLALARNIVGGAEAEALADAGLNRVVAGLLAPLDPPVLRADGTPYVWVFDTGEVRFTIEDEGAKVDINAASRTLLAALLQAVGLGFKEADALALVIVRYRGDTPTDATAPSSEPVDEDTDAEPEPQPLPFTLIEELLQVPGMTGDVYARIAPLITVHTGLEQPEESVALPEVRMAIDIVRSGGTGGAGVKQAELKARAAERRSRLGEAVRSRESGLGGGAAAAGTPRSILGEAEASQQSDVGTMMIHAEARADGGSVFVREAVVRLSVEQSPPFVVLAWRQGKRWLFPLERPPAG